MDDEPQSNPAGTAALGLGIGLWFLTILGFCVGVLPVIGLLKFAFYGLAFLLSLAAIGVGLYGVVRSSATGSGRLASIVGILSAFLWYGLGALYVVFQLLLAVTLSNG